MDYAERLEKLVEKHNVVGMRGRGIKEINVNEPSGLNTYVVGTMLRNYWSQPNSNMMETIPHTNEEKVLNLTKKGVKFLKNNIKNMIEEYKFFNENFEENNQNGHSEEEDVTLNSTRDFLKNRKMKYRINNLKEDYDIVGTNGGTKIVKKSQDITPILAQNTYSGISNDLNEDLIYSKKADEQIVGSRNSIQGERTKLAYKR